MTVMDRDYAQIFSIKRVTMIGCEILGTLITQINQLFCWCIIAGRRSNARHAGAANDRISLTRRPTQQYSRAGATDRRMNCFMEVFG
jgi:hypothetical protein